MNLIFQNSITTLPIPDNSIVSIEQYKRRVTIQKRYGKDGGTVTGDQMCDSRNVTIQFTPAFLSSQETEYIQYMNTLIGFFNLSLSPFYLVDQTNDRRCEIVLTTALDEAYTEGLAYIIGKNKLVFEMLDGHWEDNTATIVASDTGGLATAETLTLTNTATTDCYPIIRLSPYNLNPEVVIRNTTTGAAFALSSNSFTLNTTFEIDSQRGTIFLISESATVEMSAALADGSGFIKLIPGENIIKYESIFGNCDVEVEYRQRYIV